MYKYTDYFDVYGRIMQFNKNKHEPIHRWYPFVEGYSKEFIHSIIDEINVKQLVCLEPFSGSGTTSLELQNLGFKCVAFEINPFMYLISKVKLENSYTVKNVEKCLDYVIEKRSHCTMNDFETSFATLFQTSYTKKWNYDIESWIAIKKLQNSINEISDKKYKDLFTVVLASILLDSSNLYRNGKCLSYRKNWKTRFIDEKTVYNKFDSKVKNEFICDISNIKAKNKIRVKNKDFLFNKDSRTEIDNMVEDDSIDLVITSPPYLNSRDYTDTYMLELKTLGFAKTSEDIRQLRKDTLRSHVQVKWHDNATIKNELFQKTISDLELASINENVWNKSIIDMVRLYFVDMQKIFLELYKKLKNGGKVYFNVSNSAYFKVSINTLEICASIAEQVGFQIIEIRKARYLKASPQQQNVVGKLLEGVLVLMK